MRNDVCVDAGGAALTAAAAAQVDIRELAEIPDLDAVCRLFISIWQPDPGSEPVSTELLRAMTAAGNYVAGAYAGGELLGACFGFFGSPAKASLHSHIAGISATGAGRGIGFALKLHQRAWVLGQDIRRVSWTFDPLVRRNAFFNLAKLAARPARYLTDFYGPMLDSINGDGATDRLLLDWELDSPTVGAAALGSPVGVDALALKGATVALSVAADGGPVAGSADGSVVLVAVPPDIESLRRTDPAKAGAWRYALRETLGGLLAEQAQFVGFDRAGWYVLTKEQSW